MPGPLWHSDLRDMTAERPVIARFKGPPKESKMKDRGGKARPRYEGGVYAVIEIQGVGTRSYNIENADIEQALQTIPSGRWYRLTATGRGDGAMLALAPVEPGEVDPSGPVGYDCLEDVATAVLLLIGRLKLRFHEELGAELEAAGLPTAPTAEDYSFASTLIIRGERDGLPLLRTDIPEPEEPQPPEEQDLEEGTGESLATEEQLAELEELASTVDLTDDEWEEFQAWMHSGNVTRIDAAKAKDGLLAKSAES